MTIVRKICKLKYIILIPILIFIVYLASVVKNIDINQNLVEAKRLVKRSIQQPQQPQQPTTHLKQSKQHNNPNKQQPQQQKTFNNRIIKLFDIPSNDKIEYEIRSRVKRQTPVKKKTPVKASVTTATTAIPDTTTPVTTTTTTTTKAPVAIIKTQVHQAEVHPLPTLPTYTFKPSKLDKSVAKSEVKIVNPQGETITFPTTDLADLSIESMSNLLEAK